MEKSISYKDILNKELSKIKEAGITPRLLLHSCCAPCSSYVLEYLTEYFDITVYYYNPNISPMGEYEKRIAEQKRLISEMKFKNSVSFIEGTYNHDEFISLTRGLETFRKAEKDVHCAMKCGLKQQRKRRLKLMPIILRQRFP